MIQILSPLFWAHVVTALFHRLHIFPQGHNTELQEFRREPDHGETVLQAPGLGGEGGIRVWERLLGCSGENGWILDELGMNLG